MEFMSQPMHAHAQVLVTIPVPQAILFLNVLNLENYDFQGSVFPTQLVHDVLWILVLCVGKGNVRERNVLIVLFGKYRESSRVRYFAYKVYKV